ncbi:DNA mismatch repair protein MutS [Haladaptatus pallidirubidus]|uniref:DNA mismatch repair protein MutS n=1 Tax=Haladaptatus pallidirubidus TaxID=1008152 RepID=A0AAV3URK6_9EURY|nr:DNA mismatch repair protein MutS [Haladaptatus pallidirubidus]
MTNANGIVGEYLTLKQNIDADFLMMQVGDFYEFFADDAEEAGDLLDLKISQKSVQGCSYPMAGVPVDDLTPYLKQLVERGYRVAVAEQHETEDGYSREITRTVTPGTLLETNTADARYIASVVRSADNQYGAAFADITTGHFFVTAIEGENADAELFSEFYRFDPVEILPGPELRNDDRFLDEIREQTSGSLSIHEPDSFAPGRATHIMREQFGEELLSSLDLDSATNAEIPAAGAILSYIEQTGVGVRSSMTRLQSYHADDHVELDATTQRNLELTETMHGDAVGSLLDTIDHTVTSQGGRLLKEWLQRPRRSKSMLESRHECVGAFTEAALPREVVRDILNSVFDLERLATKAIYGNATPHDLLRIRDSLDWLPEITETIAAASDLADSPLAEVINRPNDEVVKLLSSELHDALAEEPPRSASEGGVFKQCYHEKLDTLTEQYESATKWIETLDHREKHQHGIKHLQVDRNKTDGYFIQVGKTETSKVPPSYEEIKTLTNSKRYTIEELREREREILRLEEQRGELEEELFTQLCGTIAEHATALQTVGQVFAEVDVLAGLATHVVSNNWICPTLVESDELRIDQGRHPVVEQTTEFVPNSVHMDPDRKLLIVTGPNMSGKSTYMRQTALITLLAQIGSFVPATEARIGIVDGIFTRVGALDELAQGRSTFMVEMQELSNILHSATENSLVILDEVGRGTATYDGISIAWAATEYLHNEVRANTLFATHYHELTILANHLNCVKNVHVAADETNGEVTFLRTVKNGPANRSYGINVAELAGVPVPVTDRAHDVLEKLQADKAIEAKSGESTDTSQQVVFDIGSNQVQTPGETLPETAKDEKLEARFGSEAKDVLEAILDAPIDQMAPIEVLKEVQNWKIQLKNSNSQSQNND